MFCPALGIPEDPVSGNAHAMLACYLLEHGIIDAQRPGFIGAQGRQMHRPGQVRVKLEFADGALIAVRIGGTAVILSEGALAGLMRQRFGQRVDLVLDLVGRLRGLLELRDANADRAFDQSA